jgi:predicted RNase H-like nuclease (RuvC/YqgF family)
MKTKKSGFRKKEFGDNENRSLKEKIQSLKSALKKKDATIDRLLSEVRTLQKCFDESTVYINNKIKHLSVEDVINKLDDRWKCFACKAGTLRLKVIHRLDGIMYFRSCDNKNCKNRTRLKNYDDSVQN